jgi:DHA2 family multidrug resistance protein
VEATIAGVAFYLFIVHTATATDRSFLNRDLLKNLNFSAGTVLMFMVGLIMNGTLALLPTMLQDLMNYPVLTTGLVTAPRGIGSMIAMFVVARIIDRIDNRLIILFGLLLTAVSMWQMTGFSLYMGMEPVITSGLLQGFGLGYTFVPLNTIALANLPRHILTQGTALRSLMRNLGGSVGISILEARLTEDIQAVHSRLIEQLRPDNPLAQAPRLAGPFSLTDPAGIAALNAEVTRQASMVAYLNDFALMMMLAIGSCMLLLLVRPPPSLARRPRCPSGARASGRAQPISGTSRAARSQSSACLILKVGDRGSCRILVSRFAIFGLADLPEMWRAPRCDGRNIWRCS